MCSWRRGETLKRRFLVKIQSFSLALEVDEFIGCIERTTDGCLNGRSASIAGMALAAFGHKGFALVLEKYVEWTIFVTAANYLAWKSLCQFNFSYSCDTLFPYSNAVSWCKSVDDSACQNTSHKLSPFEKCTTSHCSSRWWVFCTAKFGQKLMIRTPTQSSCFCVAIFGSFRSFSLRLDSLNCLEFELFATQKARGFSVRQIQTCSVHFHARK
jgi:hypothetical protein